MNLLSRKKAAEKCGFSVSTLKREEAAGRFPKAVQITEKRVGYVEAEISDLIAKRVAERDTA